MEAPCPSCTEDSPALHQHRPPQCSAAPRGLALTPPNSCHHPWGGRACWGHCPLLTTSRTRSPLRLCHPLRPRHDQNLHRASPRPPRPGALAPRNASPCSLCPRFSLVVILTDGEPAQPPAPPASGPLPVTRGPAPSGAGTGFVGSETGVEPPLAPGEGRASGLHVLSSHPSHLTAPAWPSSPPPAAATALQPGCPRLGQLPVSSPAHLSLTSPWLASDKSPPSSLPDTWVLSPSQGPLVPRPHSVPSQRAPWMPKPRLCQ